MFRFLARFRRAAGDIFDQLFQTVPGVGICRSIAVQAEPINAEAALSFCKWYFFEIAKPAADFGYVFASIFSEGNLSCDGCVCSGSDSFVFLEELVHHRVLYYFPVFICYDRSRDSGCIGAFLTQFLRFTLAELSYLSSADRPRDELC